jgi:hypothetical protein
VIGSVCSILAFVASLRDLLADFGNPRGWALLGGFACGAATVFLLRRRDRRLLTQRGTEQGRFDRCYGRVQVFYPSPYVSSPYLRLYDVGTDDDERVLWTVDEQSARGFTATIVASLGDGSWSFMWVERGLPDTTLHGEKEGNPTR